MRRKAGRRLRRERGELAVRNLAAIVDHGYAVAVEVEDGIDVRRRGRRLRAADDDCERVGVAPQPVEILGRKGDAELALERR